MLRLGGAVVPLNNDHSSTQKGESLEGEYHVLNISCPKCHVLNIIHVCTCTSMCVCVLNALLCCVLNVIRVYVHVQYMYVCVCVLNAVS